MWSLSMKRGKSVILIGAMAADTFVLVCDHEQLPPLIQSDVAEKTGKRLWIYQDSDIDFMQSLSYYSESMLKRRLADRHPSAVAQLTLQ